MSLHISQYELLSNAIEFAGQNHRVISQNIANINTPNYKSMELSFETFLKSAEKGPSGGDQQTPIKVQLTEGLESRTDGNNVDLDNELANMKRNDLIYQTLTQLVGSKLDLMRMAMRR